MKMCLYNQDLHVQMYYKRDIQMNKCILRMYTLWVSEGLFSSSAVP